MGDIEEQIIEKVSDEIVDHINQVHEGIWRDYIKRVDPHEKKYIEIVKSLIKRNYNEVILNIKIYPENTNEWTFDHKYWAREYAEKEAYFVTNIIQQEGQEALETAIRLSEKAIDYRFDIYNPEVSNAILEQTSKFSASMVNTTEELIRDSIRIGLENGETMDALAIRVANMLGADNIKNRAEIIARTETINASNAGAELGYLQSGVVEGKEWLTALDERACQICNDMNGRRELIGTSFNVDDIKDKYGLNFEYTNGQMPHPPIHPRCYDKDTELYTNEGWKLFKELNGNEKVLSLNPETFNLEWLSYINFIKYNYEGEMISINSNSFDMLVTPDHPILLQKDWDRRVNRNELSIRPANELKTSYKGRFYRSSKWIGENKEEINIDGLKINTDVFCKFMGIYLAEGSTTIRTRKTGSFYYQISIAQNHERIKGIYDNIKDMPIKLMVGKDHITSYDKIMGKYLLQFGKSYEKYIPQIIKDLSTKYIEIFLGMYCYGDGSIKKGKIWNGGKFRDNRVFHTSSKRLADDVGELILKIGHHPSFKFMANKGKEVKFKNGTYKLNTDMYKISDCYSPYASFYNIKEVPYNGMVYDIELPKNHIFYIRRNGKCVWGSNCRCAILPITQMIQGE